jgi:DivIVA domain-containing protein
VSTETSFSRALRGYDTEEVDQLVQKLRRELLSAKTQQDELRAELDRVTHDLQELQQETSNATSPTVDGLTAQARKLITKSEKIAAEIITRAEADALLIRSAAEKTSSQFISAAREGFEQAVVDSRHQQSDIIAAANQEASVIIQQAQASAQTIVTEAQDEANRLRGETTTVFSNQKAKAEHDIGLLTAEAQRTAAEMRLVIANSSDMTKLNKQLMELLKLDVEGAVVRAQMEKELQQRHNEAVLNTEKYVGAAEAQLASAKTKYRGIEKDMDELTTRVRDEAQRVLDEAQSEAMKTIEHAQAHAQKQIADAHKYVAAVLNSVYSHISTLEHDQKSIAAYFDALRLELDKALSSAGNTQKITS